MTASLNPLSTAVELPLVVHLIYRLDFGGLEMLLAECINRLPADKFRHAIVCLTDYTEFSEKITQPGVQIYALNKPPGLGLATHVAFWKLMRKLKPTILHTYNLSALEYALTATLAGVPARLHAEHGRDISDPLGKNPKHRLLRRLINPFIDCYVPVSVDLQQWLQEDIHVRPQKILLINNGVDTQQFQQKPASPAPTPLPLEQHNSPWPEDCVVIGTVGRVQHIKNQAGLVRAFIRLLDLLPEHRNKLRLSIIGSGPLATSIQQQVEDAGISDKVWLPGARTDIAELMQGFSVFTLPSLAEGTPVTLLEAMSSALPVVVTQVGGMPEVVTDQQNGMLVPPGDDEALAIALARYISDTGLRSRHGKAGRALIEQKYSVTAMLAAYSSLYDRLCSMKA